jgi:hypothetical protein
MSTPSDRLARLYQVADDYEAATLDELMHRAGLVWTCRGQHPADQPDAWTNDTGDPCEVCGQVEKADG